MWARWNALSTSRVCWWQPPRSPPTPRRNTPISTRPTRASWRPARQPHSSVTTWNQRRRLVDPASPRRSRSRGAYEADDRNSFLGDGGGNCLGAESRRHRKHEEYDEGSPAEEGDGLRCSLGGFSGKRRQSKLGQIKRGQASRAREQPAGSG